MQDAGSLMTSVTVTALVTAEHFSAVRDGLDPQSWSACSDVFVATDYVEGPYDLRPVHPPVPLGDPGPAPRLLLEDVVFLWGDEGEALGSSINVLSMDRLDFSDATSGNGGDDAAVLDRRTSTSSSASAARSRAACCGTSARAASSSTTATCACARWTSTCGA